MGIREKINDNPMIAGGITGGIILVAVIVIGFQLKGMMCRSAGSAYAKTWFTTEQDKETFTLADEGKLFFADDASKLAPFDKGGKEAVRVYLYTCDGKTLKVVYLERYTPEAKAAIDKARSNKGSPEQGSPMMMDIQSIQMRGRQIKKPGKQWVTQAQDERLFQAMEQIQPCPSGQEYKPFLPPE